MRSGANFRLRSAPARMPSASALRISGCAARRPECPAPARAARRARKWRASWRRPGSATAALARSRAPTNRTGSSFRRGFAELGGGVLQLALHLGRERIGQLALGPEIFVVELEIFSQIDRIGQRLIDDAAEVGLVLPHRHAVRIAGIEVAYDRPGVRIRRFRFEA